MYVNSYDFSQTPESLDTPVTLVAKNIADGTPVAVVNVFL